jgi:hypothetical protein
MKRRIFVNLLHTLGKLTTSIGGHIQASPCLRSCSKLLTTTFYKCYTESSVCREDVHTSRYKYGASTVIVCAGTCSSRLIVTHVSNLTQLHITYEVRHI